MFQSDDISVVHLLCDLLLNYYFPINYSCILNFFMSSRGCKNPVDSLCYICGEFTVKNYK